jgi:integrase/recombinase XerD
MIKILHSKQVLLTNATEHFELPKIGRPLPKPILSTKEVKKVLQQAQYYGAKGVRDRAIMETYYAAGIRRTELRQLNLDDIDFEQRQLRVNQGKGCKDRYVPCAKIACLWIYKYLKEVRGTLTNQHSGKTLFLANNGKAFRDSQLSELVAKYIKLSDVRKKGACNQYRHAAATHMVDNGADIRHVQSFLGHADISTTQIYVHVSMTKLREVYDKTHPSASRS